MGSVLATFLAAAASLAAAETNDVPPFTYLDSEEPYGCVTRDEFEASKMEGWPDFGQIAGFANKTDSCEGISEADYNMAMNSSDIHTAFNSSDAHGSYSGSGSGSGDPERSYGSGSGSGDTYGSFGSGSGDPYGSGSGSGDTPVSYTHLTLPTILRV